MTSGPDSSEPLAAASADRGAGRTLARWLAAAVLVALVSAAMAAFVVDRGRATQSDDVVFAASEGGSAPASPALPAATSTTPAAPSASPTEAASALNETSTTTPTATAPPSPSATVEPTSAPPPRIELTSAAVGIGETLAIRVNAPEAASASALAVGASYPLLDEGDGVFFGVVGIPLNASLGPGELTLTLRDAFGVLIEEQLVPFEVTAVERPVDYLELTEEQGAVLTQEAAALESTLRTEQFLTFDRQRRWSGLLRVPTVGTPTTAFGQGRSINGGPVGGFHSGADIANEAGTPIQAAAAGRVAWAGEMPIRGNAVILDHGGGVKTGYHHMQAILVEVGQEVAAGTVVGEMGSTGLSTGPHLHWELTIYGVNVDPMTWTTTEFTP